MTVSSSPPACQPPAHNVAGKNFPLSVEEYGVALSGIIRSIREKATALWLMPCFVLKKVDLLCCSAGDEQNNPEDIIHSGASVEKYLSWNGKVKVQQRGMNGMRPTSDTDAALESSYLLSFFAAFPPHVAFRCSLFSTPALTCTFICQRLSSTGSTNVFQLSLSLQAKSPSPHHSHRSINLGYN